MGRRLRVASVCFGALVSAGVAHAHPEDDICGPESGLDPVLCQSLSAIERDGTYGDSDAWRTIVETMGPWDAFLAFFTEGWTHVLPSGLDHLLFVSAIFLSTYRIGSLIRQMSAFTLAHTITVGMTAAGILVPSPRIIEPLIAASIVLVAFEAALFKKVPRWRTAVIFGFGLIHGMGFAGAFSATFEEGTVFWPGLAGFNLGVEAAQILIGGLVLCAGWVVRSALPETDRAQRYRQSFVWPVAALIGLAGLWWTANALVPGG